MRSVPGCPFCPCSRTAWRPARRVAVQPPMSFLRDYWWVTLLSVLLLVWAWRTRRRPRPEPDERIVVAGRRTPGRSEEHTSELQSLAYLVCRLLLEKKKKQTTSRRHT